MPSREPTAGRAGRTVSLITLGCARNDVDSEELAARLDAAGWTVTGPGETDGADVVLVNTCGFIQAAKEESIDQLLGAASSGTPVVAAGCLAERYGASLAESLPEAQVTRNLLWLASATANAGFAGRVFPSQGEVGINAGWE